MGYQKITVAAFALCLTLFSPAAAKDQGNADRKLIVGTKEAPPFVIKKADGTWGGISIDLWQSIATDLGYSYVLRNLAITEFEGEIDVLPRTFERQSYGITLPSGSRLREPLNRALLQKISEPGWQQVLSHYLGTQK